MEAMNCNDINNTIFYGPIMAEIFERYIGLIAKKFGLTITQADKKEKVVEMINTLLENHKKEALKNRMEESEKVEKIEEV